MESNECNVVYGVFVAFVDWVPVRMYNDVFLAHLENLVRSTALLTVRIPSKDMLPHDSLFYWQRVVLAVSSRQDVPTVDQGSYVIKTCVPLYQ